MSDPVFPELARWRAPRLVATARRKLLAWYEAHGRTLPWRTSADGYAVWISEIMLQQTTVAAVSPYFERFLTRFPTVADLAAAEETDVLRLWEGLGYYSRARNLHRAARQVVQELEGVLPTSVEALQKLPGIGRYTAGAIASFAFGEPAPIVEANTLRLYARLLGYTGDPRSKSGQMLLWEFASLWPASEVAASVNSALMDLGATICTVSAPLCTQCPLSSVCAAAASGQQESIPRPAKRAAVTELVHAYVAIRDGDRYLLRKHTADEQWAGLWDFPRVDTSSQVDLTEVEQATLELTGLQVILGEQIGDWTHSVTRYRIRLKVFLAQRSAGELLPSAEFAWVPRAELAGLPLPVMGRKLARTLQGSLFE